MLNPKQQIEFTSRVNAIAQNQVFPRDIVEIANIAEECHRNQVRKKNGEPYIFHPLRVAETINKFNPDFVTLAIAFLHDVIEDCGETPQSLALKSFNGGVFRDCPYFNNIINGVKILSEVKVPGNRKERIVRERIRLLNNLDEDTVIVKMADIMNNCIDITIQDQDFAIVYLKEKISLVKEFPSLKQFKMNPTERFGFSVFHVILMRMLEQQLQALECMAAAK